MVFISPLGPSCRDYTEVNTRMPAYTVATVVKLVMSKDKTLVCGCCRKSVIVT